MFEKNSDIGFDFKFDRLPEGNHFKKAMQYVHDNLADYFYKDITNINGLPVYFNKESKSVMITFSGGADSTMMLYLLCRLIDYYKSNTKIIIVTHVRHWEGQPWIENITENIIKYLDNMFPAIKKEQHYGFIPTELEITPLSNIVGADKLFNLQDMSTAYADVFATMAHTIYIRQRFNIETSFSGVTMNPVLDHKELNSPSFRDMREFREGDLCSVQGSTNNGPFTIINKDWVMAQYYNFGITDLKDMTRSCNTPLSELNLPKNVELKGSEFACGTCFFCAERQWGEDNRYFYLEDFHK